MERDAIISRCRRYRYLLRRVWDDTKPIVLIVMLNPSTADAKVDDATIRSCIRLCTELGFGGFEVINLFALRATQPVALTMTDDPIGPANAAVVSRAIARTKIVICAWGTHPMAQRGAPYMLRLIKKKGRCFGRTLSGAPRHPLYVKSGTALENYP